MWRLFLIYEELAISHKVAVMKIKKVIKKMELKELEDIKVFSLKFIKVIIIVLIIMKNGYFTVIAGNVRCGNDRLVFLSGCQSL